MRPGSAVEGEGTGISDAGLTGEGRFKVLRMHVEPGGGHDDVALAAGEHQLAFRIAGRKIASAQPTLVCSACLGLSSAPFGFGDGATAYQDLAVLSDLHLAPGERLANAAPRSVEGMIQGDERGGLGHAIALNEREAEAGPELLQIFRQGSAAADEGPELPAEEAMLAAEAPPAAERGDLLRTVEPVRECWVEAGKVATQQFQDARHRREYGDSLVMDELGEPGCVQTGLEVNLGGEQGWHPQAHELPEYVRERQCVEEAERVKWSLVAAVSADLALDGVERGEYVAVGMDDAFGLGGGAGGEDDLQWRAAVEVSYRLVVGCGVLRCIQHAGWYIRCLQLLEQRGVANDEAR